MNICFLEEINILTPLALVDELTKLGHTVKDSADEDTDIIFNASVAKYYEVMSQKAKAPKAKVVQYCWDYYLWAHEGKHAGYDWKGYAQMLKEADLILVPSSTQQKRLKELLDLDSVVVHTGIDVYDHEVRDDRFVLDPVRYYPPDPNCYWVRDACEELGIRFLHSEHQFSQEQFRELISNCTLMTCGYTEASTGGLSLMEGLWNGKPSLVSDSPYMGATDYLGKFGNYFKYDSYEDLKEKLEQLFNNPPKIDVTEAREYMTQGFSFESMAKGVDKAICELLKS